MKKIVTAAIVCFVAVCLINSCGQKTKKAVEKTEVLTAITAMPSHGVELDTAKKNVQHYVDSCRYFFSHVRNLPSNTGDSIVQAYTVSSDDLLGVLGLSLEERTVYKSCRVYLGLDYNNKFKLYLTPIKSDGRDHILYYINKAKDTVRYVYDLNAPCPKTCDTTSPLYVK
jgi:hypothetical protein